MGNQNVIERDHPRRPSRLYVALALVVAAAIFAIAAPTMRIEIQAGRQVIHLPIGATVGDLLDEGVLTLVPGDLLDVEGELLERGGGREALVFHNGRLAYESTRLQDGDWITVRNGGDVTEGVEVIRSAIPIKVDHLGKGPLVSLESPGSMGVRELRVGAISAKKVSKRVVTPMQPMVVKRYVPDPGSKVVALTFDDGPWPGHTDEVLDILRDSDVKATFFVVGYLVERYPHIAKRIVEEGHTIANHTYSHKILTRHSGETIRDEIVRGSRAIHDVTGVMPRWFRPPGGAMSEKVVSETARVNMKMVMWDSDPMDWRKPGVQPMLNFLMKSIGPGSVVLLHDGGGDRSQTVELLPQLIQELKDRDYVFLTIDELVR